jgi:MFS family permease
MLLPVGRLAVLRNFPSAQYLGAIAVVSIAGQVGPLIGPVLGGWLVQTISWHWIFLINLPIGLVGCAAVFMFLPPEQAVAPRPRFDGLGFALLALSMVSFSLALDNMGGAQVWRTIVVLLALSLVAAWAYVPHARRHAQPLFPLSLFEQATFRQGLIGNLVARIGSSAVPFLMPLLFQLELGFTPLQSGMMMLPVAIAGVACKRFVTPLVRAHGYANFLVANTVLVGGSIISFAAITKVSPLWIAFVQLAVFGAANSMQYAAMNSVTLKDLDRVQASSGNGLFSMAQMLAIGLGVTVGGTLVKMLSGVWANPILAFRVTFVLVGWVTLVSALIFRYMKTSLREAVREVGAPVLEE